MTETIELATILLTDLVGSTRLATTVGPVRADELRDEHFALLREAIESFGGREAKNTGDGLMIAFSSASAAVRCAILMQQTFERRYRRAEQQLHIRIGLGAGESTVQNGDYFGMPSIEAARLCDKAATDGILVSGTVKLLAGRSEEVSYEPVGKLELKGFSEGIEAFEVPWKPLSDEAGGLGRWQLPAVLRTVPTVSYVGREAERAVIEKGRSAVRGGDRRAALISGEPGIGKSRLAAYAALGAHGEGFAVCWGACTEELAVPYEPWIQVCSQLVENAPGELIESYVERHGGEISRLARDLSRRVADAPPPQSSDPETERFLLFSAVAALIQEVGEAVPVCIVLDDLHWADGQSVALLKHVVRSVDRGAVQVIATYRDSDLGKDHPLTAVLADLRRIEGVERIGLLGLGVDEVAQLMAAAGGTALNEEGLVLAGEIATETDGNPFFVGEVLRSLLESGTLVFNQETGRWTIDRSSPVGLPESVREVIERRVERLGEDARQVLTMASVIGRQFELALLAELVDISESRLLDHLEAAVSASLLSESNNRVGEFRFAHALINQTLYEGLGITRRARMHHHVAQALEVMCGDDPGERLAELALHWRLAMAAVDKGRAADYALRAGERALESLAPAEAVKLFGDALEMIEQRENADRCRALIGLGEAQLLTGDPAYRETLLEASAIASGLADPELAATAALANSRGITSVIGEVDNERLVAIERATELDDGSNPGRLGRLLALHASELTYDPDYGRRRELANRAIELGRQADDPRTQAIVLRDVCQALWSPDTVAQRAELVDELKRCAEQAQDPALRWWAYQNEHVVAGELGQISRAEDAMRRQGQLAEQLAQPMLSWLGTVGAAGMMMMKGDLVAGEQLAEQAFQLGQETVQSDAMFAYGAHVSYARMFQARAAEIMPVLEQSVANFPAITAWSAGLASAYALTGRLDEAAALVRDAFDRDFENLRWDAARTTSLALYAEAAVQAGCREIAPALYALLEPWSEQVVWSDLAGYGHVRLWLGLLASASGWDDRADEHLAFALRFHEENGLVLWVAVTQVSWAEALTARGDAAAAAEHAMRALELAREHGYPALEARAGPLVGAGAPVGG